MSNKDKQPIWGKYNNIDADPALLLEVQRQLDEVRRKNEEINALMKEN